MKRREFIAGLGSVAAWPVVAGAQQPAMPVIGHLSGGGPLGGPDPSNAVAAFLKGLSEMGFVEGRNVAIEYRRAEYRYDRLPEMAAELVRRRVAVIFTAGGSAAALAAKAATTTIPIVFQGGDDPVRSGVVASLSRPGGNITGFYFMSSDLTAKRIGLLHEVLPTARRFAVLVNPGDPAAASMTRDAQEAALTIGRQIEVFTASNNREIDEAFSA
jgi:putative tryptophan/tyrosine transport system substrate-binding protein